AIALLGVVQPLLHILAGGAGARARREVVHVHGALGPPAAGLVRATRADIEGDGERARHHVASSCSNPKRRMLRSARSWSCAITSVRGGSPKRCAKRRCARKYSSTGTWRLIGETATTSPASASKTGNSPVSCASRAILIVSPDSD